MGTGTLFLSVGPFAICQGVLSTRAEQGPRASSNCQPYLRWLALLPHPTEGPGVKPGGWTLDSEACPYPRVCSAPCEDGGHICQQDYEEGIRLGLSWMAAAQVGQEGQECVRWQLPGRAFLGHKNECVTGPVPSWHLRCSQP